MKYLFIVTLGYFNFLNHLISQTNIPEIFIPFYFEDVQQHKDTIFVGLDSTASLTSTWYDPQFNEVDLRYKVWDTTFEVRVGWFKHAFSTYPTFLSKQKIVGGTCNPANSQKYTANKYNYFYFSCKHFPITITWDQTHFDRQCLKDSYFERAQINSVDGFKKDRIYATGLNGKFILTKSYIDATRKKYGSFSVPDYVNEVGDTIFALIFRTFDKSTEGPTNTSDIQAFDISLSPNPVSNFLTIQNNEDVNIFQNAKFVISDLTGKIFKTIAIDKSVEIDVSELQNGLYFIHLDNQKQIIWSRKFVKIE
jgi:hypothetical protein